MNSKSAKRTAAKLTSVFAAAVVLAGCGLGGEGKSDVPDTGIAVGDRLAVTPAPDRKAPIALAGTTLDGAPLDLSSLRGHPVVLNVWWAGCGPCRAEAPALADIAKSTEAEGARFVGLHTSADNRAAAQAFVATFAIPYPSIDDRDGKATLALRSAGYRSSPTTFVLDKQGRVAARIAGQIKALQLRQLIDTVAHE